MRYTSDVVAKKKFSLVEVTIVLIIIALIIGIATLKYPNILSEYQIRSLASCVRADLYTAQEKSILSQKPTEIEFFASYYLIKNGGQIFIDSRESIRGYVPAFPATTFTSNKFQFNNIGSPSETGSVTISLKGREGSITINGVLGEIKSNIKPGF